MPLEQQFEQTHMTTQGQWAEDPFNKGDSWESYVIAGGADPTYGIEGYPLSGDADMLLAALVGSPDINRKFVASFSTSTHPDNYPLDFLNPPFPAGQWLIGSRIETIGYEEGNRVITKFKMITLADALSEGRPVADWFLDKVEENGIARALIQPLKFGLWIPLQVTTMPLSPEGSSMDRGYAGTGNGNGTGGNGKRSLIPWLLIAAVAAKVML